jgi:hypothetical protein
MTDSAIHIHNDYLFCGDGIASFAGGTQNGRPVVNKKGKSLARRRTVRIQFASRFTQTRPKIGEKARVVPAFVKSIQKTMDPTLSWH